jgi:hypothetical protein
MGVSWRKRQTAPRCAAAAIAFECGEADTLPPDGALRFRTAQRGAYAACEDRLRVTLHPGVGHRFTHHMRDNCFDWFDRHSR